MHGSTCFVERFERLALAVYRLRGCCDVVALISASFLASYGITYYPLLVCLLHAFCLSRGVGR